MDRVQTQEEIQLLINNVFDDKKRINYEDYVKINQEMTSEMFLSIMTLLQSKLPCSLNYYRYKNNYEKYIGEEKEGDGEKSGDKDEGGVVKMIASPKLMSKLSPVSNFVKKQNINVAPMGQRALLKYAVNKEKIDNTKFVSNEDSGDSDNDNEQNLSGFTSKKGQ